MKYFLNYISKVNLLCIQNQIRFILCFAITKNIVKEYFQKVNKKVKKYASDLYLLSEWSGTQNFAPKQSLVLKYIPNFLQDSTGVIITKITSSSNTCDLMFIGIFKVFSYNSCKLTKIIRIFIKLKLTILCW